MPRHPDIKPGPKPKKGSGNKKRRDRKSDVVSAQRAAEILSLRRAGWSLSQIGGSMTPLLTQQRVGQIINAELKAIVREPVEDLRSLEIQRLDELQTGIYEQAVNGDLSAQDRVLKIMNLRSALEGLNVPKLEVAHSGSLSFYDLTKVSDEDLNRLENILSPVAAAVGNSSGDREA